MLKVDNMRSVRGGKIANQFVIRDYDNNKVIFQSYASPIVEIDFANKILKVFEDWNYSKTTGKYRNQFMSMEFYGLNTTKELEKAMCDGMWKSWKILKAF